MASAARCPFLESPARPLVVGHRGVPLLHQENTLAGFRRAVSLGLRAVELDVRITRDGVAVVCHDDDLSRLTGSNLRVSQSSWGQLSTLRVPRRLCMGVDGAGHRVFLDYEREEPLALLSEVLAEIGGQLAINIELKLDTYPWWRTEIADVVAALISEAGVAESVVVTSFDLRKLRAAKRAEPRLAVGFCFDDSMLDGLRVPRRHATRLLQYALSRDLTGLFLNGALVGADHTLVTPGVVAGARERGLAIGTHTMFPIASSTGKILSPAANDEREAVRLAALGLSWIETDDPERLRSLFER